MDDQIPLQLYIYVIIKIWMLGLNQNEKEKNPPQLSDNVIISSSLDILEQEDANMI